MVMTLARVQAISYINTSAQGAARSSFFIIVLSGSISFAGPPVDRNFHPAEL